MSPCLYWYFSSLFNFATIFRHLLFVSTAIKMAVIRIVPFLIGVFEKSLTSENYRILTKIIFISYLNAFMRPFVLLYFIKSTFFWMSSDLYSAESGKNLASVWTKINLKKYLSWLEKKRTLQLNLGVRAKSKDYTLALSYFHIWQACWIVLKNRQWRSFRLLNEIKKKKKCLLP